MQIRTKSLYAVFSTSVSALNKVTIMTTLTISVNILPQVPLRLVKNSILQKIVLI
jgi:hypothetical protein